MKINTSALKMYRKFLEGIQDKTSQVGSSLYLDLDNKMVKFATQNITGEFPLEVDEDNEFDFPGFFVTTSQLMKLVEEFKELEILPDKQFKGTNGLFDLTVLEENYTFPVFDRTLENPQKFIVTSSIAAKEDDDSKKIFQFLLEAKNFSEQVDPTSPLSGVFVAGSSPDEKHVVGTDSSKFYDRKLIGVENMDVPLSFMKVLEKIPSTEAIYGRKGNLLVAYVGDFIVQSGDSTTLGLPIDIESEDFRLLYDHENKITVDLRAFSDLMKFMHSWSKEGASMNRLKFTFPEANKLNVEITDGVRIEREIDVAMSDEEYFGKDKHFWMSSASLTEALRVLSSENETELQISVDFDEPAVDFRINENLHIVLVTLEDA